MGVTEGVYLEVHFHAQLCSQQPRQPMPTPQLHGMPPLEIPSLAEHLKLRRVALQAPALAQVLRQVNRALPKLQPSCSSGPLPIALPGLVRRTAPDRTPGFICCGPEWYHRDNLPWQSLNRGIMCNFVSCVFGNKHFSIFEPSIGWRHVFTSVSQLVASHS